MGLMQNAQKEYESIVGGNFVHVTAKEATHEGDEFWYKEDGWDSTDRTEFEGVLQSSRSEKLIEEAGFDETVEALIRTSYNDAEKGDLIEHGDTDYVVISMTTLQWRGSDYSKLIGVKEYIE